ncbi:hypothetical protein [Streptomyces rishiriensis]|uniref:hypothetical protein n=1 Tax=Streptomyces rishiriensis TaxID=68264 RepID=UPI001FE8B4E8|nr:hypothetical protein [Streptomyces rishiriensis]
MKATKPSGPNSPAAPGRTSYVQASADVWLAHALAAHLGHYRDPAAREAAAGLLPVRGPARHRRVPLPRHRAGRLRGEDGMNEHQEHGAVVAV